MPHLTLPISDQGPILDLLISVSQQRADALQKANKPVPPPVSIRGLIDTGASSTCIDPKIIHGLNISPTGTCPILTPSTGNIPHIAKAYDIGFGIFYKNQVYRLPTLPVIESSLDGQGIIQALIGRDVLKS